jgi:oleandomycin transport system permease protein
MTNAIVADRLTKRFGPVTAVAGIDLEIKEGTVFGLLGPNGAGKTTTVHILSTLVSPDEGFFSRLRALPIARFAPLAGRIVADVVKQAWALALLLAVGMIMGFRVGTNPLAVLAAIGLVLVVTLAFAWLLVWVGMLVTTPERVQIFGFVLLFPLTFTSGAFVKTATMPGWLQAFSKANPVTLVADAARGLLIGGPVGRPAVEALLYSVALTAVFLPLAVRAFRRRV